MTPLAHSHFPVADAGWRWWPLHATTPATSPFQEMPHAIARRFDC